MKLSRNKQKIPEIISVFLLTHETEVLRYVRNQINPTIDCGRRYIAVGSQKKLKKLERKVKELEAKVEQLEKKTNESLAYQVACWILVILEIAVAVIAIVGSLLG